MIATDQKIDRARIAEDLEKNGYSVIASYLPEQKVDEIKRICSTIEAVELPENRNVNQGYLMTGDLVLKHDVFLELLSDPQLMSIVEEHIGTGYLLSGYQINTAPPGFVHYNWHVDNPYYLYDPMGPEYERYLIRLIFAIDDLTDNNGATAIIPGSHKDKGFFKGRKNSDPHPEGKPVTGPKGSVVVGWGSAWHSVTPNQSDKSRTIIVAWFCKPYVLPQENTAYQLSLMENPDEEIARLLGRARHVPVLNAYGVNRGWDYGPRWQYRIRKVCDRVTNWLDRRRVRRKRERIQAALNGNAS